MTIAAPPSQSQEAERAFLAGIITGDETHPTAMGMLGPGDFFSADLSQVFKKLIAIGLLGKPVNDCVLLHDSLDPKEKERLSPVIACLMDPLYRGGNLVEYAGIIKTHSEIRRRLKAASAIVRRLENVNGNAALALDEVSRLSAELTAPVEQKTAMLASCSTAELFAAQEKSVDWLCWPFAAVGLASILDALPKLGKTVMFLHGIHASRMRCPFLNFPTRPMRVCYVSEQSKPSLAMQLREIGFTGDEPIDELRWITREDWSRYIYTDFWWNSKRKSLSLETTTAWLSILCTQSRGWKTSAMRARSIGSEI